MTDEVLDLNVPEDSTSIGAVCMVTGGAGYLGGHIVRRLLSLGCEVRCFDLKPSDSTDPKLTNVQGDICNYDDVRAACEGVDTVFHAAAIINLLGLYRPKVRNMVMDINVGGTAQLLKAAADAGVSRFVYTSTNNVCFDREIHMGDETVPLATRPLDLYTETKAMAEKLVLTQDNGKSGMRTVALRPGGIWGGDEPGIMLVEFMAQLASGRFKATIGDGTAEADNTHVYNLVDAQILAAQKLQSQPEVCGGEAYYITDEEPMNMMLWFKPLTDALGYAFPTLKLPTRLMYGVGFLMELIHYFGGQESKISRVSILKLTRTHTFSTKKARRDLGYKPGIGYVEGLQKFAPLAKKIMAKN